MRKLIYLPIIILPLLTVWLLYSNFSKNNKDQNAEAAVSYDGSTNIDTEAQDTIAAKEKLLHPQADPSQKDGMYLQIPKISVDWHVLNGDNPDQKLYQGFWQYSNTPNPDQGGNTIILGHRWVYRYPDPRTLYALDKLQIGDPIYVIYNKSKYKYEMTESFVTEPTDQKQLESFSEPMLTLITSTPIEETKVLSKQRLVVRAKMVPNN